MSLRQRDVPRMIRQSLRGRLTTPVRSELPSGWVPADGPVVTVVSDGTPASHPAWDREAVRVVAYAASGPAARRLASAVDEWLIDPRQPAGVLALPGMGLNVARDVSLGCWVASITVQVATPRT